MTLPSTPQFWHAIWQLLLAAAALSVVAAAHQYPETRLPIVIWLLSVALVWRRPPGDSR